MRFFVLLWCVWCANALCSDADGIKLSRLVDSMREIPAAAMQSAVRKTIEDAWCAYRANAWGRDALLPVSGSGSDWMRTATTAADALDTLLMARLPQHAKETRDMVVRTLRKPRRDDSVSVGNLIKSVIGGLVAAHALGRDTEALGLVAEFADNASVVFDSPSGIPYPSVNLLRREATPVTHYALVAEAGSMRTEYDALSDALGATARYEPPAEAQRRIVGACVEGLIPSVLIDVRSARPDGDSVVSIGKGVGDFYGGLLKSWIQGGRRDITLLSAHQDFVHGVTTRLLRRSPKEGILYVSSIVDGADAREMGQSACLYPGILALADMHGVQTRADHVIEEDDALHALGISDQLGAAEELMQTCIEMAARTVTGMAPERVVFWDAPKSQKMHGDMWIPAGHGTGSLRPEIAESLLYLYAVTKKDDYRAAGWDMWRSIQRHHRVEHGYATLWNVNRVPVRHKDVMESWFISATLKYLYLLFGDTDIKKFVFNSMGHAFPSMRSRDEL